ncbi:GAF domain-containing protein [Bosea sp. (in: a-proteobacteria)]|uniref:GAF domain-containing protein n=1 Tax=Bosea sp. (in: a-proteobacteria) TaxID=1871050 RepID=UPI0026194D81|nr:GAF domain-containing protein [Bosea sp. (in: a-proteobacteria)]MCO5093171.1 GAF domain-containing protein [Bosea sp. (in: a-proteobacteria)]
MQSASPDIVPPLLAAMRASGQPAPFYAALEQVLKEHVGYLFVTLFIVDGGETLRVFSTEPRLYPTGVRKPMAATPWGEQVLRQQRSFLANDAEAVARTFFDHEKIASLGCGAVMSIPVVYDGRCLGVLNVNHREHAYTDDHVRAVEALAPTLIPACLDALAGRP